MARINVEDKVWFDPRFIKMTAKIGDGEKAIGCLIMAWRLAQSFKMSDWRIPIIAWKNYGLNDALIEFGLARIEDDFVYVCGSDEQFQWLNKNSENGKKSAKMKKERKNVTRDASLEIIKESDQRLSTSVNDSQPLTLTLPLTHKTNNTYTSSKDSLCLNLSFDLKKLWNENKSPSQPACEVLSKKRSAALTQRAKECSDSDVWLRIIKYIANSDFHKGKNDRGWVANFDYLIKPDTWVKISEKLNSAQSGQKRFVMTAEDFANGKSI